MGKLIIRNNGVETQLVNGVDLNALSGTPNTYVIGVNPVSSSFEQLNPDGSVINYESSGSGDFTGGTVTGETIFEGGLSASTISGGTLFGDGSNLTGVGTGAFSGGVVTGFSNFTNGLSSTSISATTISGGTVSGDGSKLVGVVGLTYSELGFTITSPSPTTINQNVALPFNSTVTYPSPIVIEPGFEVIIPDGTTLTIV